MVSLKIISNENLLHMTDSNTEEITFHKDIVEILFKHKESIQNKFTDVRGLFLIDHFSISIIDPNKQLQIYSMSPSVEFNLIIQELWKHDRAFSPSFQMNKIYYPWDHAYRANYFDDIKSIKELKHGFTFGFNIPKYVNSFHLIYSFATRSKNKNLEEYYQSNIHELSTIGDYGYKLIQNVYKLYLNPKFNMPILTKSTKSNKPFLTLI